MVLIETNNEFIAKTTYGEWEAKQAGFQWNSARRAWVTQDRAKALDLESRTGLHFSAQEPPRPAQGDQWPAVRAGRYAIHDPKDQVLKFYQVDKPEEGKWIGWTFLKVLASDTKFPIKDRQHKAQILDAIAKEPNEAMARYGQHIGSCGLCGRTLTDEESRQLGIGPICRGKLGI